MNDLTFMSVEKFYLNFSIAKMAENERHGTLQSTMSCISNHF